MMKTVLFSIVLASAAGLVLVALQVGGANAAAQPIAKIRNIQVPADYRTKYEFLGAWSIASDDGSGSKQMHAVFASPGTASAYRRTGAFPSDAVLVKEVSDTVTSTMTTGATVSHAEGLKGWFVMTKDGINSHASDDPLWGDGWGWAWFDAANPKVTTSKSYKTDCQACHVPAAATERVYIQGYPSLKR